MGRTAEFALIGLATVAFATLIWLRPHPASAADSEPAINPVSTAVPGMADMFHEQKAAAPVEPLPAQF